MTVEQLEEYANEFPRLIEEANGDTAKAALDFGLVDSALTRIEVRERLIELVGEDEDTHSYNQIAYDEYLEADDEDRFGRKAKGDRVGVVVARGTILDGSHPAGTIGGDSTAALIRQARNDDKIKAIVLRVDSGGGSAFASEIIRRECEKARADGKPVIASMGSVAASGGFWISTSSDQIWAYPSTITGSIGIFGIVPHLPAAARQVPRRAGRRRRHRAAGRHSAGPRAARRGRPGHPDHHRTGLSGVPRQGG